MLINVLIGRKKLGSVGKIYIIVKVLILVFDEILIIEGLVSGFCNIFWKISLFIVRYVLVIVVMSIFGKWRFIIIFLLNCVNWFDIILVMFLI